MNTRKIVSMLLAASLVIPVFTGCKKAPEETTATSAEMSTPPTEAEPQKVPYEESVTITNNDMYDCERYEPPCDTLYASFNGVEIWGQGDLEYDIQKEGLILRTFILKNTNDTEATYFMYTPDENDLEGRLKDLSGFHFIVHPNGWEGHLEPNSEVVLHLDISVRNSLLEENFEDNLKVNLKATITANDDHETVDFSVNQNIRGFDTPTISDEKNFDGVINGVIKDEEDNPVEGAVICATSFYCIREVYAVTDANGEFTLNASTYKNTYDNAWKECQLCVKKEGYNARQVIVYPKPDKAVTVEMNLYPQNQLLKYEETGSVDLCLQGYESDTDGSSIVVFTPFHTGLDSSEIKDLIKLTAVDFDGNKLFEYALPEEVPYVDVSKDGQYIVTNIDSSSNYTDADGWKTVILDRSGKEVYSRDHFPVEQREDYWPDEERANGTISRCAGLSNNNKYLVVGSCYGSIWVIDWQNDEVLWQDYTDGQIRTVDFSEDDNLIYISSGNGYFMCYTIEGELVWKTFVDTWVTNVNLTDDSIVMNTKCGSDTLKVLDRDTGKIRWTYPTMQTSLALAVSPDGKYVWYGGHSSSGYSVIANCVFDIYTGEIVYSLSPNNAIAGAYSGDGSIIAVYDRQRLSVYNAHDGSYLWSTVINEEKDFSYSFSIAVNYDGSQIVVTANKDKSFEFGGQAYFYSLVGPDENPEYNLNDIDYQAPDLRAIMENPNNGNPDDTPHPAVETEPNNNFEISNIPYNGPTESDGSAVLDTGLTSALSENSAYELENDTKAVIDNAVIENEFEIDCNGYNLILEGTVESAGGSIRLRNCAGVDLSGVKIKDNGRTSVGVAVFVIEGSDMELNMPAGLPENGPSGGKGFYWTKGQNGILVLFAG